MKIIEGTLTSDRLQQIETLYHAARERQAHDRELFLADACGQDQDLFRQVWALLVQDSSSGPLEEPVLSVAAALMRDGPMAVGSRVGPYQVLGRLGEGGMGTVYKARDTRLGRTVAIKIAHAEFTSRFQREAQAISSLNHPHICTLYDVGPDYLVMEFVEGETLARRLEKGRLPADLVSRYGSQIADALAAAHDRGIAHRDLKPGNIMVNRTGVKVLDFGLAKVCHGDQSDGAKQSETVTTSQAIVGTPAYMAPEQLEGKACDERTDIFALGLVLYETATGRRAFNGDSQAALIADVMRCQPVLDDLAQPLAHVVRHCLARDPADRWQSISDVKLGLQATG